MEELTITLKCDYTDELFMVVGLIVELARKRVTVRKFQNRGFPFKFVEDILEAGRNAPSGANMQPWRFIVVDDRKLKGEIRRVCEEVERKAHERASKSFREWLREKSITHVKKFLTEAPFLIVVCSWVKAPYYKQSTWLAIGYMLLAIEELGLSTVTYTPSETEPVKELLGIPREYDLEAILPLGYAESKEVKERREMSELVFKNFWGEKLF